MMLYAIVYCSCIASYIPSIFGLSLSRHSLLATRLLSQIHDTFGTQLTVKDLFQFPTVSDIARKIDAINDKNPIRLVKNFCYCLTVYSVPQYVQFLYN